MDNIDSPDVTVPIIYQITNPQNSNGIKLSQTSINVKGQSTVDRLLKVQLPNIYKGSVWRILLSCFEACLSLPVHI